MKSYALQDIWKAACTHFNAPFPYDNARWSERTSLIDNEYQFCREYLRIFETHNTIDLLAI